MKLSGYLLGLMPGLAAAGVVPNYGGFRVLWSDNFVGAAGTSVDRNVWNVADVKMNNNGELETYTSSSRNLQMSGGGTVQLVPWRNGAEWTSGRIESKATFTPAPGKVTRVEGSIRFGNHPAGNKAGIWPAFWLLGDAIRRGTNWPMCGELDIIEQKNGETIAFGTAHCGSPSGGLCNEPIGRGTTTGIPTGDFHTWSLQWDRTPGDWRAETITWLRDGQVFHQLSGAAIGDQGVWSTLAHSPYYVLLNVAVGGGFP
jgi:beta-glucanase (GH16 family)